jgi:uncharacterized membrane-anchored protein
MTRPLGASLADGLAKPHNLSGLGLGDLTVVLGLGALIVALVGLVARTDRDAQPVSVSG